MSNLEISQLYSTEKFVVIDDPVSSFDFENKVGIISFLKKQLSDIIVGNNGTVNIRRNPSSFMCYIFVLIIFYP